MNHKYKALIKQEIKGVKWVSVYFGIVFVMFIMSLSERLNGRHLVFMERGILLKDSIEYDFLSNMSDYYYMLMLAIGIGLIMLIKIQFKDYKSGETGRFLKGLPVRSEKHFLIKVGCGIVVYTVPFILYMGGIYWIKYVNMPWMQAIYHVTPLDEIWHIVNSNGYIGQVLLSYYLIITAMYLFLVLMQYLVMWSKAGLIVGGIITFVPYYIARIISVTIFERNLGLVQVNFEETLFLPWVYGYPEQCYAYRSESEFRVAVNCIEFLEIKTIILLSACLICLIYAYNLSKHFQIEKLEILMPSQVIRRVFCMGTAICSLLLPIFIRDNFMVIDEISGSVTIMVSIICGAIGGIVSWKIANLGNKKRGCVGYEKV